MPAKYNILCLDINHLSVERLPILEAKDVKRMAEGLRAAYNLTPDMCWEIYYYKSSAMNKQDANHLRVAI